MYPFSVSDEGEGIDAYPQLEDIHTLLHHGADTTILNNDATFDFLCPSTYETTADTAPFNAGEVYPFLYPFNAGEVYPLNNEGNNMFRSSYNPPKDDRTEQMVSAFNSYLHNMDRARNLAFHHW